jgi:hypothetical protein
MNEVTLVDLTRWVGMPIREATAALAKSDVGVVAQPQEAGPFGPLTTLASAAVRVFGGDQVIALVTAGRVAGFQPAPTGVGGLDHRVAVLERQVAALEVGRPAATQGARVAKAPSAAKRPAANVVKAPAKKVAAKKAPAKKVAAKKAPAKKVAAKNAPHRRGQG